ncbi:MAG: hypothetical protein GY769_02955 [bacterium]|nr:hypothetical protein [bacterium]
MGAFPTPCPFPGCGVATRERFCEKHERSRPSGRRRPSARKALHKGGAGYGASHDRWRKLALAADLVCHWKLDDGSLCLNPSVIADHVVPVSVAPELRYEPTNSQGLCVACHNRKTSEERRGIYRSTRTNRVERYQRPQHSEQTVPDATA